METSDKHPVRVADNFWFVFFAYFLAIAAWHSVCGNVFISSRWRTVAETRKRGQRHLFVLLLVMSYLAVYVYLQAKSGDYKEVCLTLVAFVVAISHLFRTVLALWQLHIFKHWLIRSICSMQSLGYRIQLPGAENGRDTRRGRSSVASQEQGRDQTHSDADNMIVNDSIVGNRLSEGGAQCELLFFTPKQQRRISNAECLLMRVLLTLFNAVKSTLYFGGIVSPLLCSRSPLYSKPASTPFLRPREPEELWLRWATVLISRAFPDWLTDMRKSHSGESICEESEYQVCRDRFAEGILGSAALHCERDTTKTSPGSYLPFHLWHKFPKLSSGTLCKQEFLKHACVTGNGLPFQEPHKHAVSRTEGDLVYTYAKYGSKLEQARDALPANEGEKLAYLGIEELEWLSIFLSIENWSIGSVEEDFDCENLSNAPNSDCRGIAIENLCNQLGFLGNMKGFSERLAAPFLKGRERVTLWGNRNVLTLSAHVDNWLALLAGEQVSYMVQQVPSMEEGFLSRNVKAKDIVNRTQERVGVNLGLQQEIIRLEKQRFMFQLSVADPEFSHFEKSLTFLGCSMENLRSSMAKWVESKPEEQSGAWAPTLVSSRLGTDAVSDRKVEFHASKDFEFCLSEVSSMSCWTQRYLQMRLLWELQNVLHSTLSGRGLSPNQTEAMLLCILSFPAIRVLASENEQTPESNSLFCCIKIDEKPKPFRIEDCKLSLWASYSPQNVHIEVFFTREANEAGIAVTAQLCCDELEKGKPFVWQAWRDAFYTSLQSTRQWQVEHQVATSSLSVRPCIDSIGKGICEIETGSSGIGPTMKVWRGWPPHRETLSKYEMMTDGLILERKKTAVIPAKARNTHRKRSAFVERPCVQYGPVSYEEATGQYLTYASLIAQDILRKAAGGSQDEAVVESSKGYIDLELLHCEILASKADDGIALGKAMNMLMSGDPNREAIERAVELLEGFFTSQATKAPSVRILASLSRPARRNNWVQKTKVHYEELMTATSFDPRAVISFADFCSAVPSHRKEEFKEDGIRALEIAILRTAYSGNLFLAFELTDSLELLIGTGNEEWFSLACSMLLSKIDHASKILNSAMKGVTLTNTQPLRRDFKSLCCACIGFCIEDDLLLLSDFELELDKRKEDAQDRLGQLFKLGTYEVDAHASRAAQLYSQAADAGNLVSAYHLGLLLENGVGRGNGVPVDPSRAMELYTRAINGGIDSAVSPLAGLYADGHGVAKNISYAVELYTQAIEESGDILAMYSLGRMLQVGAEGVPVDLPRAMQLFARAVEEGGDVDSMHNLAYLLKKGADGVPKDIPYALRLYERAVEERGDPRAKNNLAQLLKSGEDGVPVNLRRAVALYRSAVDEGDDTKAMVNLGELYLKGTGVPHDAVRATQLFQRAIDKDGNAGAMVHLADLLIEGAIGVPRDPIRAVELYTRAIEEHGNGDAMFELGRLLEFGKKGVPSDSARAFSLYNRAASEKNHDKAARRLKEVEKQKQVLEQVKHRWSR